MTEPRTDLPWIFDGHNDLPTALRGKAGYAVDRLDADRPELHTDIPKLRRGNVGAQFWSAWTPSRLSESDAVVAVLEQIDAIQRIIHAYPETFAAAYTADDVLRAREQGKIASLIGVEGGHAIASSLAVLRALARLGVRYLTLTHNDNTSWADSATDEETIGGLNEDGRAVIRALNTHGILVDLSHTSPGTQRDALAETNAPVLFSHSSVIGVANHPRNVTDGILDRLPGNGGVIQLTFVPYFISPALIDWQQRYREVEETAGVARPAWPWPAAPRPAEPYGAPALPRTRPEAPESVQAWLAEHPKPAATIEDLVAHIEYARDRVGIDHIGLGGDYDGVDIQPVGLEDVSTYPALLDALAGRGWSGQELEKLAWRNVLRVLRDAENVADERLWPSPAV